MHDCSDDYALLARHEPAAKNSLAAVVGQHGENPLATLHLMRPLAGETGIEIAFADE